MCNNILQQKIILRRRKKFCMLRALAQGLQELHVRMALCCALLCFGIPWFTYSLYLSFLILSLFHPLTHTLTQIPTCTPTHKFTRRHTLILRHTQSYFTLRNEHPHMIIWLVHEEWKCILFMLLISNNTDFDTKPWPQIWIEYISRRNRQKFYRDKIGKLHFHCKIYITRLFVGQSCYI